MKFTIDFGAQWLSGVIEKPRGRLRGTAVVMHGLSGYKEQPHIETLAQACREAGLQTVRFDCRHAFGASSGKLINARLGTYVNDLARVMRWLKHQGRLKPPVWLVGHSLGGAACIVYAAKNPQMLAGVVPVSAVTGYKNWLEAKGGLDAPDLRRWRREGKIFKVSSSKKGASGYISWQLSEELKRHDVFKAARQLRVPGFLAVASGDVSTPPATQRQLAAAWGGPVEMHVIEAGDHSFKHPAERKKLGGLLKTFLARYADNQ